MERSYLIRVDTGEELCGSNGCDYCSRHPDERPKSMTRAEWAECNSTCRYAVPKTVKTELVTEEY